MSIWAPNTLVPTIGEDSIDIPWACSVEDPNVVILQDTGCTHDLKDLMECADLEI